MGRIVLFGTYATVDELLVLIAVKEDVATRKLHSHRDVILDKTSEWFACCC